MAWIAVSPVIGSGKNSRHLLIIASTVTVTTCQCKWRRLRWIRQWFETNARYNFSVLRSISQYLASVVTGLRLSVDMRPSTSPSVNAVAKGLLSLLHQRHPTQPIPCSRKPRDPPIGKLFIYAEESVDAKVVSWWKITDIIDMVLPGERPNLCSRGV